MRQTELSLRRAGTSFFIGILFIYFFFSCRLSAQNTGYAGEVVKTLASPEFKGRGYVEEGTRIAADYIKSEFTSIGLRPFKKDYGQAFKTEVNIFPGKMSLRIGETVLIPGKDYIIDPSSPSFSGEYSVYRIRKADLLNEDLVLQAVGQSKDKFILIDETGFPADDKDLRTKADQIVQLFMYSPLTFNAGTIVGPKEKLDWSVSPVQASKPSFLVSREVDLTSPEVVRADVEARLTTCQVQNLAGYVEGSSVPDSFLVVMAHYDHLGMMGENTVFPGANDNASGIAMLLTLAKHYQVNPHRLTLVFIALAGEEPGIVGAKHFAENPLFNLKKIKFLINFDLAGTGEEGIKVVNGSVYPEYFDRLVKLNAKNNYLPAVQARGAACNSDHCPFHEKGVSCFYIYTLGGIKAYHDIYDQAETLPLTEFADYSKLMIDFMDTFK